MTTAMTFTLEGMDAIPSLVSVTLTNAQDQEFHPQARESKIRVRSAIIESGYKWAPATVSLDSLDFDPDPDALALMDFSVALEIRHRGFLSSLPLMDLPIALAILQASGQVEHCGIARIDDALSSGKKDQLWTPVGFTGAPSETVVVGELSLCGGLRAVRGVSAIARALSGVESLVVPSGNAQEAASLLKALESPVKVYGAENLEEVVAHLDGSQPLLEVVLRKEAPERNDSLSLDDIRGQEAAKEALRKAAESGHNVLLVGPPGSAKRMLARRLGGLLEPLETQEKVELTTLYSVAGLLPHKGFWDARPFRAPHHTISDVGLIGGGMPPRPGEVSLAHKGVLFLDELPEFRKHVLEVLTTPLEDKEVSITRRFTTTKYPADILLVGAMNACPCGYKGSTKRKCRCSPERIEKYRNRISHLMPHFDVVIEISDDWS